MVKLKNNLYYDVFVVTVGGGGQLVAKPGDIVDVSDIVAEDLVLQGFEVLNANVKKEVKNG